MASLYKRANGRQRRILRIVEGAVKNVADHHGHDYDPRMARSIAKRAAGTLSSQWDDVLAVPLEPSDKFGSQLTKGQAGGGKTRLMPPPPGRRNSRNSPSLKTIIKQISTKIAQCKHSYDIEDISKVEGLIEALRIIDRLKGS